MMKMGICLFAGILALQGRAHCQDAEGITTISSDPSTLAVTAMCETTSDGDGWYEAEVICTVTDSNGKQIASQARIDTNNANGYAAVTFNFTGTSGLTYTASGSHSLVMTTYYQAGSGDIGPAQYVDEYNFSSFMESPQTYDDDYDWFGPGPEVDGGTKTIHIGNTRDQTTVGVTCPTSVVLGSLHDEPITLDPSLRTGYGVMSEMNLAPTSTDWSSASSNLCESIAPLTSTCPSNIVPFTATTKSCTFRIGGSAVPTDYASMPNYPTYQGKQDVFYDEHFDYYPSNRGASALASGSCIATATQTYSCNGKRIGIFSLTKKYTYSTIGTTPATIVSVTKQ